MTTFTFPGKIGDALHQWPVAFWWHLETGNAFDVWLDQTTCGPLKRLIEYQEGVHEVRLMEGIESYGCGGQPWHFNIKPEEHEDRHFVHCGLRAFPQRQLTLQAFEDVPLTLEVDKKTIAETPNLRAPELPKANRLVLHGTGVCQHNHQTPGFWRFLARNRGLLESRFDEIVFVGSPEDRDVGLMAYPGWQAWDDGGEFLNLASYVQASRMMIGCGSSNVVVAGALKTSCIRVHDAIGEAPKVIWSNLGSNQRNETELELRGQMEALLDELLTTEVTA